MNEKQKLMTEVIFRHKEKQKLEEFATFLETIAQKLRTEKTFSFVQSEKEIIVSPNDIVKAEIDYTKKGDRYSLEFEIEWVEGQEPKGPLKIK